jgi:hypothetical protein
VQHGAAGAPAVGSECAGDVVVTCFPCGTVLRKLAQVADALYVDEALVVPGAGAVGEERVPPAVISLPRDTTAPPPAGARCLDDDHPARRGRITDGDRGRCCQELQRRYPSAPFLAALTPHRQEVLGVRLSR